jgi:hypothetical protein
MRRRVSRALDVRLRSGSGQILLVTASMSALPAMEMRRHETATRQLPREKARAQQTLAVPVLSVMMIGAGRPPS